MEEVAMCIEFDGVAGTGGCLGLFGDEAFGELLIEERPGESRRSEATLFKASGRATGSGGGLGEIETIVIDAECA